MPVEFDFSPYPTLFPTPVELGCGAGWYPLLNRLFADLEPAAAAMAEQRPRVRQVKEKFGGLRVHLDAMTPAMRTRIQAAQEEAAHTCEACGAPGQLLMFGGGYYSTRCQAHPVGGKPGVVPESEPSALFAVSRNPGGELDVEKVPHPGMPKTGDL